MLKIGTVRWRGKCSRHPSFDPYADGRGAIRGACSRCTDLADIHECHERMVSLMRRFSPPPTSKKRTADTAELQESLF